MLFWRFGALKGFCGLCQFCSAFKKIVFRCSVFSLPFLRPCSVCASANIVLVFVAFFLAVISAVLFCRLCAFFALLPLLSRV